MLDWVLAPFTWLTGPTFFLEYMYIAGSVPVAYVDSNKKVACDSQVTNSTQLIMMSQYALPEEFAAF